MTGIVNFSEFVIAGILLNLTPGADSMYIIGRSIAQGKKAGVLSALGIATGALLHCILATLGIAIILARSPVVYQVVKYAGAGYLVYLGIMMLWPKHRQLSEVSFASRKPGSHLKVYVSGILTNVLNPKTALFFLAFLPQFVTSDRIGDPLPFVLLGLTFVTTGAIWCLLLAVFAATLSDKIRANPLIKTWLDRITGTLFILLGITLVA